MQKKITCGTKAFAVAYYKSSHKKWLPQKKWLMENRVISKGKIVKKKGG